MLMECYDSYISGLPCNKIMISYCFFIKIYVLFCQEFFPQYIYSNFIVHYVFHIALEFAQIYYYLPNTLNTNYIVLK